MVLRQQLPALARELETMRGLRFERAVKLVYFQAAVHGPRLQELRRTSRAEESLARESELLVTLGVRTQPWSPSPPEAFLSFYKQHVAAFFDPQQEEIVVLPEVFETKPGEDPTHPLQRVGRECVLLHELEHVLQFQHDPALFEDQDLDSTQAFIRDTLREGDAEFVSALHWYPALNRRLSQPLPESKWFRPQGNERWSTLELAKQALKAYRLTEEDRAANLEAGLKGWEACDLYDQYRLTDPYYKGPALFQQLQRRGGWKAVDAVLRRPPTTTAQLLHPEQLLGQRKQGRSLALADLSERLGPGWRLAYQATVGERNLRTWFENWTGNPCNEAAAGWAGDQAQLYLDPAQGRTAVVWLLAWDSPRDRREFAEALAKVERWPPGLRERRVRAQGDLVVLLAGLPPATCDPLAKDLLLRRDRDETDPAQRERQGLLQPPRRE